jgi:hypothetical protein
MKENLAAYGEPGSAKVDALRPAVDELLATLAPYLS